MRSVCSPCARGAPPLPPPALSSPGSRRAGLHSILSCSPSPSGSSRSTQWSAYTSTLETPRILRQCCLLHSSTKPSSRSLRRQEFEASISSVPLWLVLTSSFTKSLSLSMSRTIGFVVSSPSCRKTSTCRSSLLRRVYLLLGPPELSAAPKDHHCMSYFDL